MYHIVLDINEYATEPKNENILKMINHANSLFIHNITHEFYMMTHGKTDLVDKNIIEIIIFYSN